MKVIQVAMNTADMAGSLRLYSEAFGFANSGGQGQWGGPIRMQGLQPDARAIMWWLVGSQSFFQMEFFHHTQPRQRPLRADWQPSDHGWVRCGICVVDFDQTMSVLAAHRVASVGEVVHIDGLRRAAFRDPYVGIIIEVMEDGPQFVAHSLEVRPPGPALIYATSSVSDLASAKSFYRDVIGLQILPIERLHGAKDEALWGLQGAVRDGFIASDGEIALEIVEYQSPRGRPRPMDHRLSDQGIANVALGSRNASEVLDLITRVKAAGYVLDDVMQDKGVVGTYINAAERELELGSLPEELDSYFGFTAVTPFLDQM